MALAIESRELLVPQRERFIQKVYRILPLLSELFWGVICLMLFMILGPFSAPVALIAVFSLRGEERGTKKPELQGT